MKTINLLFILSSIFILFCQSAKSQDQFLFLGANDPNLSNGIKEITQVNGRLIFTRWIGSTEGEQLFSSDGTREGTVIIDVSLYHVDELTVIDNFLYFSAEDVLGNRSVYIHNGMPGSPLNSIDVYPNMDDDPSQIVKAGNRLYWQANVSGGGRQVCSITGNNPSSLHIHTAPAPYNSTGLIFTAPSNGSVFGMKGMVASGSYLYFIANGNMFRMDTSSLNAPVLVGPAVMWQTRRALYPFNGAVYYNDNADLKYADASGINTLQAGINPTSFKEFNNILYYAASRSAGPSYRTSMYSLDVSNTITEFPNIPLVGTSFGYKKDYSLVEKSGKLFAWLSDPNSSYGGYFEMDMNNPAVPNPITIMTDDRPDMDDHIYHNGYIYYSTTTNISVGHALRKINASSSEYIATTSALGSCDIPFGNLILYNNDLYYTTCTDDQIVDCNGVVFYTGFELFKLTDSQLDCSANIGYSGAIKDGIYESSNVLSLNTNAIISGNSCVIYSAPSIVIDPLTQINTPAIFITNNKGCP